MIMSKQNDVILQFEKASRSFGTGGAHVQALLPASFVVRQTELVAIMGPSGSGKSTILSLAGAMDHPSSGTVRFEGQDIAELSARKIAQLRRRRIGYVFQEFNLMLGLTAVENVALPLELDGVSIRESREAALEALDRVNIRELADRFPDNLSGGEQQRVAIARSFVGTRDLLLADEPTGALDSGNGEVVMRILREQCDEGRSVLLVTHNASHAAWADRVIFLKDGEIVDESPAPSPDPEVASS